METRDNEHILSTCNRNMLEGWLMGLKNLKWKSYQSTRPSMQLKAAEKLMHWADWILSRALTSAGLEIMVLFLPLKEWP